MAWFCLGVTGLVFRVVQLWVTQNLMQGLAWGFKIITDPFHDVMLYLEGAACTLLRGQLIDPMDHVGHGQAH